MSLLIEAAKQWITQDPPSITPCTHLIEPGMEGVWFDSIPFKGKPTRVFAWIGFPESASPERPVPGIVLVHGGGGTAFARWVRWWNQRGYAAIAMDTCGAIPLPETGILGSDDWPRHSHSGPPGCGSFGQADWSPEDQWCYHAPAAVIGAHTLLGSFPEVDAGRIGLTGISWGGYLTCLVAGLDPRFRAAAPVYGCGYVSDESTWTETGMFTQLTSAQNEFWRNNFDPARVLDRVSLPLLWLNGTNDFAYWPSSWQRSIQTTKGPNQLCLKLRWPHGHIPEAEEARELEAFFGFHLNGGRPMLSVSAARLEGHSILMEYGDECAVYGATVVVTVERGRWPGREWYVLPAEIHADTRQVSARLPKETTAAYLNLVSEDWLTTTSNLIIFD